MLDQVLNSFAQMVEQGSWLSLLLAFVAGLFTSITPCALSSVPLVIAYVGGTCQDHPKKALELSFLFALGTAFSFTTLGLIASLAGRLLGSSNSWWYIVLGILMILMALQTWEIIEIIPSSNLLSHHKRRGYLGAFLAGIVSGIFSSPCSTPVLVVLLGLIANGKNLLMGVILMFFYSLGHSGLTILAGTSMGFVRKLKTTHPYHRWTTILKILMGLLMLVIGLYMFYLGF